jgi:hypothetical protein
MPKPLHKVTDENRKKVEQLAGVGLPQKDIAVLIEDGIAIETLRKHYMRELDLGSAKASAKVGNALFTKCMDGDTTSLIFWAKTRMGWKETQVQEVQQSNEMTITVKRAKRES